MAKKTNLKIWWLISVFLLVPAFGSLSAQAAQSGSIVAWGRNNYGQGNVPVPNSGFIAIAAGGWHNLGLKEDGSVAAWENNIKGQCNVPAPNSGFTAIAGGKEHSLGLKEDSSVAAWGSNWFGQLNVPAPNSGFIAIAEGLGHCLGLKEDGSVAAWGYNTFGQCNVPAPNSSFIAIAGGYFHSLGLKDDGSVVAWGGNGKGQCNVPAPNSGFIAIAASGYHSLGLKEDGSVAAWGSNYEGEGNVPAPNNGFIAIAAGWWHSLGLREDGSVAAWGLNDYGQCNVPAPNSGFIAIAAGYYHSVAIDEDTDDDGIPDPNDNCPATVNPWQSNVDDDGMGDLCDTCPADPLNQCNPQGSAAAEIKADQGGTIQTPNGALTIDIDPFDLFVDTTISVTEIIPQNPEVDLMIGPSKGRGKAVAAYDLEPDGMVFASTVTVTITVDVTGVPAKRRGSVGLYLWDQSAGAFVPVQGAVCTGTVIRTCTAELAHFSTIAMIAPHLHVDNDAPEDPGPDNPDISDPNEDGGPEHPFDAIQEAIDECNDGDTVIVLTGTFTGTGNRDIDFGGKAITMRSTDPDDPAVVAATVIDCQGTPSEYHRGFNFHSGEDANSMVAGFTIVNGYIDYGGGIYCYWYSSPTISNCTFSGNSADYGGGMFNYDGSSPTVINCTFSGNSAGDWGGGMFNYDGSSSTVTNCTFGGNSAGDWGGGMFNGNSDPTLTNCTFSNNSAGEAGGAICNELSSNPTVSNCILWGNTAPSGPQIYNDGTSSATVSYSDVEGSWPGTENIDEDPIFIDANGVDGIPGTSDDEEGYVHLRGYSPCINAGDPGGNYSGQVDVDNQPRVAYGRVDIGADEVFPIAGDIDTDEDVDFADFAYFANHWLLGP